MASSTDNYSKRFPKQFRDFPNVPLRHRKILDKLARCSFCDRLCCCIEHCLIHERKHSVAENEKSASGTSKTHEWVEASESTLTSRVVKSEFPFFCVYCNVKVQDENDLRQLMDFGPSCSFKKCHWMVPLAVYHQVNRENESREIHMDVTQARGACNFPRLTPRKTPEKSLLRTALSNCLHSTLRTPVVNSPGNTAVAGPLTSTPEDERASGPTLESNMSPTTPSSTYQQTPKVTPRTKVPTGILSSSPRTKSRLKSGTTRKVTFCCDHDIVKFKTSYNESSDSLNESGDTAETGNDNESDRESDCDGRNEGTIKGDGKGDWRYKH